MTRRARAPGRRRARRRGWELAPLAAALAACSPGETPLYTDVTRAAGIDFHVTAGPSGARLVVETMTGGLAWIDHDGDGDFDLYCVNAHGDPQEAAEPGAEQDRLYANDGRGRFTDVSAATGVGDRRYGFGAAVGDYDGDGDSDLLVTNFGRNTLHRNAGGVFSDVTDAAGLVERGFNMSAAWFDLENDGDLDLYVVRYLRYDPKTSRRCRENGVAVSCHPKWFPGEADLLYVNRGDGTFAERGAAAGIDRGGDSEGKGLGIIAFDHDRDGRIDLFVANDTTPNFLYRNRGDGTFEEIAAAAGVAFSAEGRAQAGMGVDAADADGDALTDIYVTNFGRELSSFFVRRQKGGYVESSRRANLGETYQPLGFGTLFVDVDLDGDQDIVTVNGHINEIVETTDPGTGQTYRQRPDLFLNGGAGTFAKAGAEAGSFFGELSVGRGLASCDFDGDRDIDLAVMTLDRGLVLLRNESPRGRRSAALRLAGRRGPSGAEGARVEVHTGGKVQIFEHTATRSYLSACDPTIVVGLGALETIDRVVVHWPSGTKTERRGVKAGELTVLREE